jgi:hypothetical protein
MADCRAEPFLHQAADGVDLTNSQKSATEVYGLRLNWGKVAMIA